MGGRERAEVAWPSRRTVRMADRQTAPSPRAQGTRRSLLGLSIGHLLVDGYASFPAPLLSSLATALGVPYAAVSTLIGVNALVAAVANILLGLGTDRWRRIGGITAIVASALTVCCMSAIGVASSYWLLAGLMAAGLFGCGAYHPPAFAMAGRASSGRRHQGVSIVMSAGIAACGLGPVFVSQVVHRYGLGATPWCALPGLVLVVASGALLISGGAQRSRSGDVEELLVSASAEAGERRTSLVWLFANAALRAYAHMGLVVVVSYFAEHVWRLSVAASGWGIGCLQVGAGLGILLGGHMTQTGGERKTIVQLMPVCLALLIPMAFTTGKVWYVWLFFYGMALNGPNSVAVGLAQRLAPGRSALVSGLLVGPTFALGAALASATTPLIAARFGQVATMAILAVPLVLAWLSAQRLPTKDLGSRPAGR